MRRTIALALCAGAVWIAACSSPETTPRLDSTTTSVSSSSSAQSSSSSSSSSGTGGALPALRSATTRSLLPTSVENLLLDPFITTDESWGHFVGFFPPLDPMKPTVFFGVERSFSSQSPIGTSAPVVSVGPLASMAGASKLGTIVAPFPGGMGSFNAQIWASASDDTGAPIAFEPVAHNLVVSLLPNDLPDQKDLLAIDMSSTKTLGGREWVKLVASIDGLPEGGWFSIAIVNLKSTFMIAAPEVTPADASDAGSSNHSSKAARTDADRAAISAYVTRVRKTPRRRRPHD